MKRHKIVLSAAIVSSVLVCLAGTGNAIAANGDAPYPTTTSSKVAPKPPVCTPTKAVAVAGGVATQGICKDAKGNKVYGGQFSYKNLTVTGLDSTACPVKITAGSAGTVGRIPIGNLKGVTVTYSITMWVPKTTKHMASVKTDPRSTRTFTVTMPGKQVLCSGNPTFTGDPNDPTGNNKPGSAAGGFLCVLRGSLSVSQDLIAIPTVWDCSGNGVCTWGLIGRPVTKFWLTYYPGAFDCSGNGVSGVPAIGIDYRREDGSSCVPDIAFGGVTTVPLPKGWGGTILRVGAILQTTYRADTYIDFPRLIYTGPLNGTPGGPPLC